MRSRLASSVPRPDGRPSGRSPQRVERAALDERFERALVERFHVDALREVFDARELAALGAGGDDAFGGADADVLHVGEAEDDRGGGRWGNRRCRRWGRRRIGRRRVLFDVLELEGDGAAIDVGRADGEAEAHALGDGLGDALVGAGAREHGGHVLVGVVRLQVRGLVGDGAVAGGVRLVEGVAGERLDQVEDGARFVFAVAVGDGGGDELIALGVHQLDDLLRHRFAHRVGVFQ